MSLTLFLVDILSAYPEGKWLASLMIGREPTCEEVRTWLQEALLDEEKESTCPKPSPRVVGVAGSNVFGQRGYAGSSCWAQILVGFFRLRGGIACRS